MALRFNPPPGWPPPPADWEPPEGWQPDPQWPAAPEGWAFWVPEETAAPTVYWTTPDPPRTWTPGQGQSHPPEGHGSQGSQASAQEPGPPWPPAQADPLVSPEPPATSPNELRTAGFRRSQMVALVATLAVALGSVVPFVSYEEPAFLRTWQIPSGALVLSFLFGAALTTLVALTRRAPLRTAACLSLLFLALLGFCAYLIFTVTGLTRGIETSGFHAGTGFPSTQTVHWSPGIGIVLCIVGTAVTSVQSILILRDPN